MRRIRMTPVIVIVVPAIAASLWQTHSPTVSGRLGQAGDAVTWTIEPVDTGRSPSLAIGGDGTAHVAYYQGASLAVTHAAMPVGGAWAMRPIGGNGSPDTGTAIGIGPDGDPRVAFGDAAGRIMFGTPIGAAWELETVENARSGGTDVSIDIDVVGQAVISYYIAVDQDLKVMAGPDDGFRQVRRISLGDVGRHSAVAAAAEGDYHVVYQDTSNRRLMYERSGREGVNETVAVVELEGQASIDVDQESRPHIAYVTGGQLRLARRIDGTWIIETIVEGAGAKTLGGIRVDSDGREHVVFHDAGASAVRYARRGGAGWQIDDVEAAGSAPIRSSLALDTDGNPHVVWGPTAGGSIRYAAGRLGAATPSATPSSAPSDTPIPPFRRPTATPGVGTPTAAPATNTPATSPTNTPRPTMDPGDLTERIFLPYSSK